jgi:hypothetical protein
MLSVSAGAQMVTGVWHGKLGGRKVELKIIQKGDSLEGTSYYYDAPSSFRRFSIKGYFDRSDNTTVWWDDQLLEEKMKAAGQALLARADFNCPGGGVMKLDGKTYRAAAPGTPVGDAHLEKSTSVVFPDEWDEVIDNYTLGGNDPDVIDSVAAIALHPVHAAPDVAATKPHETIAASQPHNELPRLPTVTASPSTPQPVTIEQKFTTREKLLEKEIVVDADSVELRFYDNAEIDGDSISLFLDSKLIFEHIRLSDKPYIIKLPSIDLKESSELTMVAENLGEIPPNTSYMVAIVGEKRYDAQLASTENSSAVIRLERHGVAPKDQQSHN